MPELLYTAKADGYLHHQTPLVHAVCSSHYEMTSEDLENTTQVIWTTSMMIFFSAFLSFLEPRTDLVWKTVLTFWVGTSWGWVNNGNISGWTFLSRLMLLSYSFIQIDLNRDHRVSTADYTGILFWSASLRGSLAVFGSWPRCFLKDEEMP